jgi:site-specific DNA-methyltransferase (adenine-specific)
MKITGQNDNRIINGNCIDIMCSLPWASVDFILTDPPYLVNYRDRSGRNVANDNGDGAWLKPVLPADAPRGQAQQPVH